MSASVSAFNDIFWAVGGLWLVVGGWQFMDDGWRLTVDRLCVRIRT